LNLHYTGDAADLALSLAEMMNPVVVVEYDPNWPKLFQFLRERLTGALGGIAAAVEHVGSTAVPGLAAKPVIDIDVLLTSTDVVPAAIELLARIGYSHQGDLGISEREAFLAPANDPPHHLYVCPPSSREFQRHVALRDYLRSHPEEAKAYGNLKKTLALEFAGDRTAYIAGKDEFVAGLVKRAIQSSSRS
jgi:GrpB-like predicted nucleotidyltransferase (UPF0157 family)